MPGASRQARVPALPRSGGRVSAETGAARFLRGQEAEEEMEMVCYPKSIGAMVLRLMVGLALLGCARAGGAQGTWSVISLPQQPGQVKGPRALTADAVGDLYVADHPFGNGPNRLQKRDTQGN